MDFKDIKNTWKDSFKDNDLLNKDEIENKLEIKSKSNTAISKVKRNYKIELYSGIIVTILFLILMYLEINFKYKFLIMFSTTVFFGILLIFTLRNYMKIRNTVISSDQIKPGLIKTIKDIERYVNFNKSNYTKYLLLPFSFAYGMFIGLLMNSNNQDISQIFTNIEIIKYIAIIIVFSVLYVPVSQYLNKKMYKQHLDELKKCLEDFEEIEE